MSGQLALNKATKDTKLVGDGDVKQETEQVLSNLKDVLTLAGSRLSSVVQVTAYLTDMNDYAAFNEVYAIFFFFLLLLKCYKKTQSVFPSCSLSQVWSIFFLCGSCRRRASSPRVCSGRQAPSQRQGGGGLLCELGQFSPASGPGCGVLRL